MPDQRIFFNTEDEGVLYVDLKELAADKKQLELSDLKKFDIGVKRGFVVSMII